MSKVEGSIIDFAENEGWTGISTKGIAHKTQWVFEAQGGSTKFTYILEYRLPVLLQGAVLPGILMPVVTMSRQPLAIMSGVVGSYADGELGVKIRSVR